MKNILFLTTGGTIASAPGPEGLTPQRSGDELLALLPGLSDICRPVTQSLMDLDSTNIAPADWLTIARAIWQARGQYDGVVLSHGTDTMAYSAAVLSLMLENLDLPVMMTGAQLPIEAPGTDGKRNLLDAFTAAAGDHPGVYVVFDGKVIPGEAAYKQRTIGFDAFVPVNRPLAGEVVRGEVRWTAAPTPLQGEPRLRDGLELRVALLKLTPATSLAELDFYVEQGWKGLVVEGFGAGGIPERLLPALHRAAEKMPVVLTSQCRYDGVDLGIYGVGFQAAKAGVTSGGPYTPEYWAVRLMWALGNDAPLLPPDMR